MRILFTADWQAKTSNLAQCEQVLWKLLADVRKYDVHAVVHLGDLKDAFNPVDIRVLNFIADACATIAQQTVFHVVMGNHDLAGPADGMPSIEPLLRGRRAIIHSEPRSFPVAANKQVINAEVVPYIRDSKRACAVFEGHAYDARATKRESILLFHADITGSKYDHLQTSASTDRVPLECIDHTAYVRCFGGHIHLPQTIAGNVHYAGSPFCCDWSEVNQQKSFLLWDSDTDKITRIPTLMPGLYDPSKPGFKEPANWKGSVVRVALPGHSKAELARESASLKRSMEKSYPEATVEVVPQWAPAKQIDAPRAIESNYLDQFLREHSEYRPYRKRITRTLTKILKDNALTLPDIAHLQGVKFLSVAGTNVLSFEKVQLDLSKGGLTLVTGKNLDGPGVSNGAGKTNLLALLPIALFDESLKGQNRNAWAREGAKKSTVELVFDLSDGSELVLKRGKNPALFRLIKGGVNISSGSTHETQRLLTQLLGFDKSVLTNTLFLGQQETNELLTGSDKPRKELLGRFLQLGAFEQIAKVVSAKWSKLHEDLECLDSELVDLRSTRKDLLVELKEEVKLDVAVAKQEWLKVKQQLSALERTHPEGAPPEKETLARKLSQREAALRAVTGRITERIERYESELITLKQLGDCCPTCKQPVARAWVRRYQNATATRCRLSKRKLGHIVERRKKVGFKLVCLNNEIQKANTERYRVRDRLENLKLLASNTRHLYDTALSVSQGRKAKKQKLAKVTTQIKAVRERFAVLQQRLVILEKCAQVVSRSGLLSYLIQIICPKLNEVAQEYSQMLANGAIQVSFESVDGDLIVSVTNPYGSQTVKGQSQGEKQIANIITYFALRSLTTAYNVFVLDEPGEGLDEENSKQLALALNRLKGRFENVFVVTHNPVIREWLEPDHMITVVKKDGVSRIEGTK